MDAKEVTILQKRNGLYFVYSLKKNKKKIHTRTKARQFFLFRRHVWRYEHLAEAIMLRRHDVSMIEGGGGEISVERQNEG